MPHFIYCGEHYHAGHHFSRLTKLKEIILELESLKGIKFGSFELKNGITSPVYFDLRVIISKPKLLREISRILWEKVGNNIKPDLLCGVPYTALPIVTLISDQTEIPMLIRRKEMKNYGTKKIIEGSYEEGQNCLIIEVNIKSIILRFLFLTYNYKCMW